MIDYNVACALCAVSHFFGIVSNGFLVRFFVKNTYLGQLNQKRRTNQNSHGVNGYRIDNQCSLQAHKLLRIVVEDIFKTVIVDAASRNFLNLNCWVVERRVDTKHHAIVADGVVGVLNLTTH